MRQVELLMIFTAIKFSIVVYSQGDNCHDCLAIECHINFNIYVSHNDHFCNGSGSLMEEIYFQYNIDSGNWISLNSYNTSTVVEEFTVKVKGTKDSQLQFRWMQNNTLESPAWAIDDIVIDCSQNPDSCYKSISFEETLETIETSLLECHSGAIHQATAHCSQTQNSMLMNGTERELRMVSFSFSNCDNVSNHFLNTCKACNTEIMFNTTWPSSYVNTQLTLPCMISEANITRMCKPNGVWDPSPIASYNRCAKNPSVCIGPSLSHGLVWPTTEVNETARIQCHEINEAFWTGLYVTRKCLDDSIWGNVDTSQCTIKSNRSSFIIYSTSLNMTDGSYSTSSQINTELRQLLDASNMTLNSEITVKSSSNQFYSGAVFVVKLTNNLLVVNNIADDIDRNFEKFHKKHFIPSQIVKMIPNGVCHCTRDVNINITRESAYLRVVDNNVCLGSLHSPCVYNSIHGDSKCNRPFYAGNDILCGQDTDQDGVPDVDLGCDAISCNKDVCPWIYDAGNQNTACHLETNETQCCIAGKDDKFGIYWQEGRKNSLEIQPCPNGTGITSRYCNASCKWDDTPSGPDVKNCSSFPYQELLQTINMVDDADPEATAELVERVHNDLANLINSSNYSMFPLDINTTYSVIKKILDTAEMTPYLLVQGRFDNTSVGIISDLLEIKNEPGYAQLTDINHTVNQVLIENSERLGSLLANSPIIDANSSRTYVRKNVVMSIEKKNASSNSDTLMFPMQESPEEYSSNNVDVVNNSIRIPGSLIQQRARLLGLLVYRVPAIFSSIFQPADNIVPIASIIYFNLGRFLPKTNSNNSNTHIPHSLVLSSQVGNISSPVSSDDPVVLEFRYSADRDSTNIRCAFWNFSLMLDGEYGGWDTKGVSIAERNDTYIRCNSTHLTCFVVLVDISGETSNDQEEVEALSIVSYFGCAISMLGLLGAMSILVFYRKTLLKEIHNFAHLNLAVALFLALTVFVVGIETATGNEVACTAVATLLHYLFTAVFSWMLCEGIILYTLVVKVFSSGLSKKKWPYLLLGWGIPLPIVATAVGIAHDDYGTDDFCWISLDKGAIWAFVGPMLLIILINTIFLIMTLQVVFKSKVRKRSSEEVKRTEAIKTLIKAAVVLLPLLGLTWIFGLLAVNEHLSVFAWLFTVLNSLQGLFIFIFHVIRHEKIRTRIKDTTVFKALKYLVSIKDRVTYTMASYKTEKPIRLGNELCNPTFKPLSAETQVGGNRQAETVVTKTFSTPLSSDVQQQANSAVDILCTAV